MAPLSWCAARTGFPAAWDARIPAPRRLLLPFLVGAGFGALAVAVEEATHSLRILEGLLGPATVAFPASLLVYGAGAIKWELLFLLFPVPLLLWLVSGVALRGRGQARTFWVLAALSAAVEPPLQGVPLLVLSAGAIGPTALRLRRPRLRLQLRRRGGLPQVRPARGRPGAPGRLPGLARALRQLLL